MRQPSVFISHTTQHRLETQLAHQLAEALELRGLRTLIAPKSIPPGDGWEPKIVSQILEGCTHFLVIVSPASVKAPWVLKEMELALQRKQADVNFTIIPLMVGSVSEDHLPPGIASLQHVVYHPDPRRTLEEVLRACGLPTGEPDRLRELLLRACDKQVRAAQDQLEQQGKYRPKCYVRRKLDFILDRFLADEKSSCVVVVDEPGTGKTSLLAYEALEFIRRGVPTVLLASHEYLEFGAGCSGFDEFVLKAIYGAVAQHTGAAPGLPASLEDLVARLPHGTGLPKLAIVLDGLNELHSAGQTAPGYEQGPVIGSQALRSFLRRFPTGAVKLLASSRQRAWESLYKGDSPEWQELAWQPDWADIYRDDFLGGVGLMQLGRPQGGEATVSESSHRVVEVALGNFTDLETALALGYYQRLHRIRIVPGPRAFEQLRKPYLLGLCFKTWQLEPRRQRDEWYYVEPSPPGQVAPDQRIGPTEGINWFELMERYWEECERRVERRAESPTEPELSALPLARVRASVRKTVETLVSRMWRQGNDRTPLAALARSGIHPVVAAMASEDMLAIEETAEGDKLVRFPVDLVAGFHVVRHVQRELKDGKREVLQEFLEKAEEHDQFAGLLSQLFCACERVSAECATELAQRVIWRDARQPQWFMNAVQSLPHLSAEARASVCESLLWRLASWLVPQSVLGELPADALARLPHVRSLLREAAGSGAAGPVETLLHLPESVRLSLSSPAQEVLRQVGELTAAPPDLAAGTLRMLRHALDQLQSRLDSNPEEGEPACFDFLLSREHEYHNLGNDYYKIGEFREAIACYRKALRLRPDLLESHFNQGLAHTRLSEYAQGLDSLNEVLKLNPDLAEAYYTRGLIREYRREFLAAIQDYEEALRKDPEYRRAAQQLLVAQGKLDAAQADARQGRAPEPGMDEFEQAMKLAKAGNLEGARELLRAAAEKGLKLTPDRHTDFSFAVWMAGHPRAAIDHFRRLLWLADTSKRDTFSWLLDDIGAAYSDLSIEHADAELEYTLAANAAGPDDCHPFGRLASCFSDSDSPYRDLLAASREVATSLALRPDDPWPLATRAFILKERGKRAEALQCYRAVAEAAHPGSAAALLDMAEEFPESVGPAERTELLSTARDKFHSLGAQAEDLYTLSSMANWLYCGARTLALLGDEGYIEFADRARKLVCASKGLVPYCRTLDARGTKEDFLRQCDELEQVFRQHAAG